MPAVKVRDEGRIARLVSLAFFLSTRSEIHIDELCERLGTDRAQIQSDLNILMFCGLPPYSPEQLFDIIIEDDFVSMYFNDVFIEPLRLTEEERAHVVIALARLASQTTEDKERSSINEVSRLIDASNSEIITVEASPAKFDGVLRDAISQNLPLEIEYLSLSSASIGTRIIEPRGLYTAASITYVFALSQDVKDFRVFRTDRILNAELRPDISLVEAPGEMEEPDIQDSLGNEQLFIETRESYADLSVSSDASWILDTYPHEIMNERKSIYRFYTPSPYFPARLLVSHQPYIRYVGGSFSKEAILKALKTISDRMNRTAEGYQNDDK